MFGQRFPMFDFTNNGGAFGRVPPAISAKFESAAEAKSRLELLVSGVFRLLSDLKAAASKAEEFLADAPIDAEQRLCYINALARTVDLGSETDDIMRRKQALLSGLRAFGDAVTAMERAQGKSKDRMMMAVRIEWIQTLFLVTHCRETRELMCDEFESLFGQMIGRCMSMELDWCRESC